MWSRTASVLTVCRSQYRFHFYQIVFVGVLVLAGLSIPARSQEQATSGYSGFADESTSNPQYSKEGSLSELTDGGRFELLGSMGGQVGPISLHVQYAYVGFGQTLTILDVSDPGKPVCVKRISRPRTISSIINAEDLLIVGDESGEVCVYNLIDPATPVWLNRNHPLILSGSVQFTSLFFKGSSLYAYWGGTLFVVDLTDPTFPKVTGSCDVSSLPSKFRYNCQDIWVEGRYAFLVNREVGSLLVIDLQQGANPVVAGTKRFGTNTSLHSLTGQEKVLYAVGTDTDSLCLFCIDISEPISPFELGTVQLASSKSGILDFAIKGSRLFITGSYLEVVDVSDPTEPLRYVIEKIYGMYTNGRSAFDGEILFVTRRFGGEIICIDWTRAGHPRQIGTYKEPLNTGSLTLRGSTLYMAGGFWIVDVSWPDDLEVLSKWMYCSNNRPVGENLMIAVINNEQTRLYDVSNPSSPTQLSSMKVLLYGNVIFEDPYLYGVSRTTGLTVIDLQNPSQPRILFRATPAGEETWADDVYKEGNFIYTHKSSLEEGLVVYEVSQPDKPVQVGFTPTNMTCYEMKGVGKNLYMCGHEVSSVSPSFTGYDLSNPITPQRILRLLLNTYPFTFDISSGLAYIGAEGPIFHLFDITQPSRPRQLLIHDTGPGVEAVTELLVSGSLVYMIENSGLSIYRHVLPATPTEVTFTCEGLVHQDTRDLHFKIFAGEPPEGGCNTPSVIDATPLVDCQLGCPYFTSDGMVACDETPFNLLPTVDCEQAVSTWLDKVVAAIGDQAGDMLRVTRISPDSFSLESIQSFYGALYGDELALPWQENRVLYDCPIYNLMDGVDGNENQAETGGFGIVWNRDSVVVEPTVTSTASSSKTPIPTPTASSTATPIPTATITETFTLTATQTRTKPPTITPTLSPLEGGSLEFVGCLGGESRSIAMVGNYAYAGIGAISLQKSKPMEICFLLAMTMAICTFTVSRTPRTRSG